MPFVKGQSGNPAGRPVGCKNKINRDFDEDLLKKGEYLRDNLFKLFSMGNATALRLVMQRMSPVAKGRPIEIELPPLNSPADRPAAMEAIKQALCEGEITIDEATGLISFVDKALGYDHAAVAKGQLVALMREIIGLRSEVALMAARLDAELGPDNFKAESMTDPTGVDAPAASDDGDARSESPAAIDQINAESTAAASLVSANGHASDEDTETPYGTRPAAMAIGDEVLALMQGVDQLQTELADRIDAVGEIRHNEPNHAAA